MKKIGIALMACSLLMGFSIEFLTKGLPIEAVVGFSFGCFLMGIYLLILSKNE